MTDFDPITYAKHAAIEADLVSSAALGPEALQQELTAKIAELIEDDIDIENFLDVVAETQAKVAAGDAADKLTRGVALATLAAGPLAAGARFLARNHAKDKAWEGLTMQAPELLQQDPKRAKAIFDLLHHSSPHLATNVPIAADLMGQMMSVPSLDLGTAKTLSEIQGRQAPASGLDLQAPHVTGLDENLSMVRGLTATKKESGLVARFTDDEGNPTFFNWASDACKTAGLGNIFSGSGETVDQQNQMDAVRDMPGSDSLLPLDAVVRELIMKEQELLQREDVLRQQEMQMQQAMSSVGQMRDIYQDQYGPLPGGEEGMMPPGAEEGGEEGMMPPGAEEGLPPGEEGAMPPGEEGMMPGAEEGAMPPGEEGMMPPEEDENGAEVPSVPPGTDLDGSGDDDTNGRGEIDEESLMAAQSGALPPGTDLDHDGDDDTNGIGDVDESAIVAGEGDEGGPLPGGSPVTAPGEENPDDLVAGDDVPPPAEGDGELTPEIAGEGGAGPTTVEGPPPEAGAMETTTIPGEEPGPQAVPGPDGSLNFSIPLPSVNISVKVGESNPITHHTQVQRDVLAEMDSLFS